MEDSEVGGKRKLEMAVNRGYANKRSKDQHEYPSRNPPNTRGPLAEAVVSGQRVSRLWNEAWKMWVMANHHSPTRPPCDPSRWEPEQLKMFFDDIGRCFLHGGRQQKDRGFIENRGPNGFDPYFQQDRKGPSWDFDSALMRNSGWGPPQSSWDREPPRGMRGGRGRGRLGPFPVNGLGMRGGMPSFAAPPSSTDPMLIKFVKEGQRNCLPFKEFWVKYCEEHGGGTYDPRKHSTAFFVGCALVYGVHKLVDEAWAKPYLGSVGIAGRPLLARIIKRGQRDELKESWKNFCEKKGEGKFDPELYDPQTLFEFMGTVGMETYKVSDLLAKLSNVP